MAAPGSAWQRTAAHGIRRASGSARTASPDRRLLQRWRQFNLEYFPRDDAAPALTFFPFLDETTGPDAENNLYPLLHLLPNGTVFVFSNDRAVVFDPYNRAPLRRLPAVAVGVPRNYPSSASSVLLPLHPDAPRCCRSPLLLHVELPLLAPAGSRSMPFCWCRAAFLASCSCPPCV